MTWELSVDVFLSDLLKHERKSSTVKQYRYEVLLQRLKKIERGL
ncbi:hypothetical protein IKG_05685 [Bacillus cereus VD200]|nr:hypothetical protein IKG_05685 [Bacillus cereus VD200]